MTTRRARLLTLAAPAALLVAALSGCDAAGDAVGDRVGEAADRAGCAVAQRAVDEVASQARSLVDDIGADPQAAQQRLEGLRDTLDAAAGGLEGPSREQVDRARDAVEALAGQAQQAADGTQVDDVAVQQAQGELDAAVDDLTQVC